MQKGTFAAITFSLVIHGIIFLLILFNQSNLKKPVQKISKNPPIKSFIYYSPTPLKKKAELGRESLERNQKNEVESKSQALSNDEFSFNQINKNSDKLHNKVSDKKNQKNLIPPVLPTFNSSKKQVNVKVSNKLSDSIKLSSTSLPLPAPAPAPKKEKLDSFTQLQRLRSKLNTSTEKALDNPYQREQPPSIFNSITKSVPHSVPLKDEEETRKKNTKNMGAGIAITKGEDGRCSVTQDLSAYGLSEGSSTQFFSCGESKFDRSFREHMKVVKAKLGKK